MKNLIVASVGDNLPNECVRSWIEGKCNFDLMCIYYGHSKVIFDQYKKQSKFCFWFKHVNAKFHCIYNAQIKNIIFEYDYILFADDDVLISTDGLNNLFKIANDNNLQICQPAIYNTTYGNFLTPQSNNSIRYTTFVEIMFPLFNKDALDKCLKSILLTESSWGSDVAWWYILGEDPKSIAVIDSVEANHIGQLHSNISRFKNPIKDLHMTLSFFGLHQFFTNYSSSIKNCID